MENRIQQQGFTLIELIVTVAIFGILLGLAAPSFTSAVANSQISAQYNDTIGAFFIARSEAVKSSGNITVCARKEDQSKTCKTSGGDWSHGLLVYVDNAPLTRSDSVVIGSEDELLHVEPPAKGESTITAIGSTNNTHTNAAPRPYVTYNPNGSTNWRGVTLTVCDERGPTSARAMNIVITGDIRRGRSLADSDTPRDTFNRGVTCP